jgi:5-hydroxyisourate hydrolase
MSISTHVLDTSAGRAAGGVTVRLERRDAAAWTELARGTTNADGRVPGLTPVDAETSAATYRLTFDVGPYFQARGVEAFYQEIAIDFIVRDAGAHYHVPLLVSPFGYSTYRGS